MFPLNRTTQAGVTTTAAATSSFNEPTLDSETALKQIASELTPPTPRASQSFKPSLGAIADASMEMEWEDAQEGEEEQGRERGLKAAVVHSVVAQHMHRARARRRSRRSSSEQLSQRVRRPSDNANNNSSPQAVTSPTAAHPYVRRGSREKLSSAASQQASQERCVCVCIVCL